MVKRLYCFTWIILYNVLLPAFVYSKNHENPASELLDIINKNRTAQGLKQLHDSPGLGCMALQYVKSCNGNCTSNNTLRCHAREDDFMEVFGPNCGVELPTFGTISGQILGCQSKYVEPSVAFSHVLFRNRETLSLIRNKSHTELGTGFIGIHKGPFLWGVLFSNSLVNSTFVLEDRGEGIKQREGCFSGSTFPCNGAERKSVILDISLPLGLVYIYVMHHLYFCLF